MKLAIVGTRHPAIKYAEFEKLLLSKIDESEITQVISGGAEGIDTYAKLFAGRHRIPLMEFCRNTQYMAKTPRCGATPKSSVKPIQSSPSRL